MSDIAHDLGLSVATVSKVLADKGNFGAKTRKRVLKRARELNYQTNWAARSLVTRRTDTIGLLLPDFVHPFFAAIAKAVADTVRPNGYHVIISYYEEDAALEINEAESLLARQVDGLILASVQSDIAFFERIRARQVPFVLIDRPIAGVAASFVGGDNQTIGRLATDHLIRVGCRRIAHLRGPEVSIAEARLAGCRRALEAKGLRLPTKWVVNAGYEYQSGYEAMRKLLRAEGPAPDGVFCYNDPVAIGAMKAISEAGLRVPEHIAVVGAGNVHFSEMLAVPLTTVDQQTGEIGRQAAELLMKQIMSKRKLSPKKVLIPPKLVIRQSTRRAAAATA